MTVMDILAKRRHSMPGLERRKAGNAMIAMNRFRRVLGALGVAAKEVAKEEAEVKEAGAQEAGAQALGATASVVGGSTEAVAEASVARREGDSKVPPPGGTIPSVNMMLGSEA